VGAGTFAVSRLSAARVWQQLDEAGQGFRGQPPRQARQVEEAGDDPGQVQGSRLQYSLSGVYTDANKIDKAVEVLRALLKDNRRAPRSPTTR